MNLDPKPYKNIVSIVISCYFALIFKNLISTDEKIKMIGKAIKSPDNKVISDPMFIKIIDVSIPIFLACSNGCDDDSLSRIIPGTFGIILYSVTTMQNLVDTGVSGIVLIGMKFIN